MSPAIESAAHWKTVAIISLALLLLSLLALASRCHQTTYREEVAVPRPSPVPPIGLMQIRPPAAAVPADRTQTEMRNVDFHEDQSIILHIRRLRGEMYNRSKGEPLNFDNKRSFILGIDQAEIGLDGPALTDLMNHYVFAYAGAPLHDLQISMAGKQIRQEGTLHKAVDLHFVMDADVSATPSGMIRIHPTKIKILGINGESLMKTLGLNLQKMIDVSKANGVTLDGNDLLLDPMKILPPPEITGHVASVRVDGSRLMLLFDSGRHPAELHTPVSEGQNWMYFRGGTLRMGKLFMVDADMLVLDTDPSDPFEFFIDYYNNQLAAGFDRNQSNYGLVVSMRDWSDLGHPVRAGERLAPGAP